MFIMLWSAETDKGHRATADPGYKNKREAFQQQVEKNEVYNLEAEVKEINKKRDEESEHRRQHQCQHQREKEDDALQGGEEKVKKKRRKSLKLATLRRKREEGNQRVCDLCFSPEGVKMHGVQTTLVPSGVNRKGLFVSLCTKCSDNNTKGSHDLWNDVILGWHSLPCYTSNGGVDAGIRDTTALMEYANVRECRACPKKKRKTNLSIAHQ